MILNIFGWFLFINFQDLKITEANLQRCSVKKVFLKLSQNSQENTYAWGLQLY